MHDIRSKRNVRAALRTARAALSEQQRATAARAIREELLSQPEVEMAGTIAAYVSIGTEPDTRGLLYALWKKGSYVLLPRLLPDNDLDWASYEGPDSLVPGKYGLYEPTEPGRGAGAIGAADVVIVPALAVDRQGVRLGRGGGSYDRVLERVGPGILTVALLYDDEFVDELPKEAHDRPVRAVVTPSGGFVRFR